MFYLLLLTATSLTWSINEMDEPRSHANSTLLLSSIPNILIHPPVIATVKL